MAGLILEILRGPEAGRRAAVTEPVVVGRGRQANVVLVDRLVSAQHARVTPIEEGGLVEDLGSRNGTFVNGVRISSAARLRPGDQFTVGVTLLALRPLDPGPAALSTAAVPGAASIGSFSDPRASIVVGRPRQALRTPQSPRRHGDLTEQLISTSTWNDKLVAAAGIPIVDVPFVTVGGGLGSFIMVDVLRIAGVPIDRVKVLTLLDNPWQTYEYLTTVSQIPLGERLRSDSSSTPDNIWGFPSYAFREAFESQTLTGFLAPLWNVLTENILTDYWTPTAGQVFRSLQREADRIGYWAGVAKGQVRMVRKRHGGGYFSVLTPPEGTTPTRRVAYRSQFAHLAIGYPGLRFLNDLQAYRERYGDSHRMVNAYEPHEHVYDELGRRGGKVLVRGGGIVASRILQRLIEDRDRYGAQTQILHLLRTYVHGPHGPSPFMRRQGGDGWAYQGFNWPKGTWGGQLKARLAKLEGQERGELLKVMGGTTTPKRKLWQDQLRRARQEGYYRTFTGEVDEVMPGPDGTVITRIRSQNGTLEVAANFIIDATGLESDIAEHRVVADLLEHSGAGRNPLGRLDVERTFEVRNCRSEVGRLYASGSITLGGYYAGVDSFLGLQYAALQICDDLARQGLCTRIGATRSISQWWKWARNLAP